MEASERPRLCLWEQGGSVMFVARAPSCSAFPGGGSVGEGEAVLSEQPATALEVCAGQEAVPMRVLVSEQTAPLSKAGERLPLEDAGFPSCSLFSCTRSTPGRSPAEGAGGHRCLHARAATEPSVPGGGGPWNPNTFHPLRATSGL